MGQKNICLWKRQRTFILILSIRSNGDHMNTQLLILHWIPIITPPSMECNCALVICGQHVCISVTITLTPGTSPNPKDWHKGFFKLSYETGALDGLQVPEWHRMSRQILGNFWFILTCIIPVTQSGFLIMLLLQRKKTTCDPMQQRNNW